MCNVERRGAAHTGVKWFDNQNILCSAGPQATERKIDPKRHGMLCWHRLLLLYCSDVRSVAFIYKQCTYPARLLSQDPSSPSRQSYATAPNPRRETQLNCCCSLFLQNALTFDLTFPCTESNSVDAAAADWFLSTRMHGQSVLLEARMKGSRYASIIAIDARMYPRKIFPLQDREQIVIAATV